MKYIVFFAYDEWVSIEADDVFFDVGGWLLLLNGGKEIARFKTEAVIGYEKRG